MASINTFLNFYSYIRPFLVTYLYIRAEYPLFRDTIDQPIVVFQDEVILVINLRKGQRYEFGFLRGKIMIEPKQQPDFI